jgi:hypothetical protein
MGGRRVPSGGPLGRSERWRCGRAGGTCPHRGHGRAVAVGPGDDDPAVTTYTGPADLSGTEFAETTFAGSVFREVDLTGTRIRGALLTGADIESRRPDTMTGPRSWTFVQFSGPLSCAAIAVT